MFLCQRVGKIQALLVFCFGFACRQKPNVLECAVGIISLSFTLFTVVVFLALAVTPGCMRSAGAFLPVTKVSGQTLVAGENEACNLLWSPGCRIQLCYALLLLCYFCFSQSEFWFIQFINGLSDFISCFRLKISWD